MIFADTSALYTLLDRREQTHAPVAAAFRALMENEQRLVTTNYVVHELISLAQRRIGMDAVDRIVRAILPVLSVSYVDQYLHETGLNILLRERRRHLSLTDCTSIAFMRRAGITQIFALDSDFAQFGITSVCSTAPD